MNRLEAFERAWIQKDAHLRAQIAAFHEVYSMLPGIRPYTADEVDQVKRGAIVMRRHGADDDDKAMINTLGAATNNFTEAGIVDIQGGWAANYIDRVFYLMYQFSLPDNTPPTEIMQCVIGGQLEAHRNVDYAGYQLGVMMDVVGINYKQCRLALYFVPTPKVIVPR